MADGMFKNCTFRLKRPLAAQLKLHATKSKGYAIAPEVAKLVKQTTMITQILMLL
jgi:hypothetical protein